MRPATQRAISALGLYLGATLLVAAPQLPHLTEVVLGDGGDPWQTMWRFEDQASRISQVDFWQEFFGGGEPRLVNYATLSWLPLQFIFGQPLAYNVAWVMSFALSGWTMYLLVRYLVASSKYQGPPTIRQHGGPAVIGGQTTEAAALIAGLYYMLLPYHLAHARGHFGAMQLQWLPLALLLFLMFFRKPAPIITACLAAVFAIQAWTEHHYALWLALFFLLYLAFNWRQAKHYIAAHWGHVLAIAALLFLLVVIPYWPTLRLAGQANSLLELGSEQTIRFSADLVSYLTPPLLGTNRFTGNAAEATEYLGLVALLLIGFFRHRVPARQYYFWLTVAAVFFIISLGPRLHVFGRILPVPLPFAAIGSWPVFSSIRAVGRAGVMVGLSAAVVLGWVAATQVRRPGVAAVLALLLVADFYWGSLPAQSAILSPAYTEVKELPGSRLIELPAPTNYTVSSRALYASHRHGKEVVGSIALERATDAAALEEVRSLPALRHILYLRTGQLRLDRPDFFNQALPETLRETMDWLDVGAIVIHRDSLSVLQLAALQNFLSADVGLQPVEFNDVVLYPVPVKPGATGDGIFLSRDGRWANVGFDEKHDSVFAEILTEAGISLYNTRAVPQTVRLLIPIAPESHGTMLFISNIETKQLLARGGETLLVEVVVAPRSQQNYVFRNQLTQPIIIENPRYEVINF